MKSSWLKIVTAEYIIEIIKGWHVKLIIFYINGIIVSIFRWFPIVRDILFIIIVLSHHNFFIEKIFRWRSIHFLIHFLR